MFEDLHNDKNTTDIHLTPHDNDEILMDDNDNALRLLKNKKVLFIVIIFFISIASMAIFILKKPDTSDNGTIAREENQTQENETPIGGLPTIQERDDDLVNDKEGNITLEAEKLSFGWLYNPDTTPVINTMTKVKLPINTKTEVANYYDMNRKINFDNNIAILNQYGTTIVKNNFKENNDFLTFYKRLAELKVPALITDDFLFYLLQNTSKEVFAEIKEDAFYDHLWNVAEKSFFIANARYEDFFARKGEINDPLLEGARLEAAFFAVALEILQKKEKGIINNQYRQLNFNMPEYLQYDVLREVELIDQAKASEKSPILLYKRDYGEFATPKEYEKKFRLAQFHKATQWMSSLFPLFPQNSQCPDCLLDKDDQLVSLSAANFIARDFAENQDIKNDLSKLYKVQSYTDGLRQNITYIHYTDAFKTIFLDRDIEDIFNRNDPQLDSNLTQIQNKLLSHKFPYMQGWIDGTKPENRHLVGLRILTQNFWPEDYMFSLLVGERMGEFTGDPKQLPQSACRSNTIIRCRGTIFDTVNIAKNNAIITPEFLLNSAFLNYQPQINIFTDEVKSFNRYHWNENKYWSTLNTASILLNKPTANEVEQLRYEQTAAAAMTNLKLPPDAVYYALSQTTDNNLDIGTIGQRYFIETDIDFIRSLVANANMLRNMFKELGILSDKSFGYVKLNDMVNDLNFLATVVKKELQNEVLSQYDVEKIQNIISRRIIKEKGKKITTLKFKTNETLKLSIDGIDILLKIYNLSGKNMLFAGPIFSYTETLR